MRLKEEKIKDRIFNIAMYNVDKGWRDGWSKQEIMYWEGYTNALRLVVKMAPDDKIYPEEDYD